MRSLIAIAALVASVSASAGELDGKALDCGNDYYEFRRGKVVSWKVWKIGTVAKVSEFDQSDMTADYHVFPDRVWWIKIFSPRPDVGRLDNTVAKWTLDRATLELAYSENDELRQQSDCEVYTSLRDFKAMMEKRRAQMQAEIDEEMKDNKI